MFAAHHDDIQFSIYNCPVHPIPVQLHSGSALICLRINVKSGQLIVAGSKRVKARRCNVFVSISTFHVHTMPRHYRQHPASTRLHLAHADAPLSSPSSTSSCCTHETAAAAATARAREEKSIHFYLSIACIVQSLIHIQTTMMYSPCALNRNNESHSHSAAGAYCSAAKTIRPSSVAQKVNVRTIAKFCDRRHENSKLSREDSLSVSTVIMSRTSIISPIAPPSLLQCSSSSSKEEEERKKEKRENCPLAS
jgi:hypothetical protein